MAPVIDACSKRLAGLSIADRSRTGLIEETSEYSAQVGVNSWAMPTDSLRDPDIVLDLPKGFRSASRASCLNKTT